MILETLEIEGAKMDKIYIRSIAEYLDKLEELGEEYPSISTNPIVNNFQDAIFLFRGINRKLKVLDWAPITDGK